MEIIIGVIVSMVVEAYKMLQCKFNKETSKKIIYSIVFILALVWTALRYTNMITEAAVQAMVTIVVTAIGTYELIIKPAKKVIK